MRRIISLLLLLGLNSSIKAANPDTIVCAHTLKATANYENDVKSTKEDQYLFIWVGSVDLNLFEKLKNERNTFINELPGTKMGLLVAKGQLLQEIFDAYALTDFKVIQKIKETYLKIPSFKLYTLEEQLLGQVPVNKIKVSSKISPYPTQTIVQAKKVKLFGVDLTQAGMHKHQCGNCGTVWAHFPGGSHTCPNCGHGEWRIQYQGPKPATFIH